MTAANVAIVGGGFAGAGFVAQDKLIESFGGREAVLAMGAVSGGTPPRPHRGGFEMTDKAVNSPVRATTGDAIVKSLRLHGVDTIFGIPGAHMYEFNDAIAREEGLKFITTRHEQGAGYMAYGYAKSTGRTGVFTVVPGPGILNASAALCTAYGANTAVLGITGNIMSHLIGRGRGQLHELPDQLGAMRGVIDYAERIDHPHEAAARMADAFRYMRSGRIRPAVIEAPWDVFGKAATMAGDLPMAEVTPLAPEDDEIDEAVNLILAARNPLIVVGAGALEAAEEVGRLARLIEAPVTSHRSGRGIVPADDPYSLLPPAAYRFWPKCDLVIGIGSRLELTTMRWRWSPPGLKSIRIDCDPTEMVRLPCDAGVVADAGLGTAALIDALETRLDVRPSRADEFDGYSAGAAELVSSVQPQIAYLEAIRKVLPRDGFFVEEISQMGFTARIFFPVYAPRQYVTCGYQDNLGFGFHTGLGVKVAHPDKPVVSISGDGGFMFGVQELATAVQYGINLVTVVFDNRAYGNVRRDQMNVYDGRFLGSELRNPDFVKLAESFGAKGVRAESPAALAAAIEDGLKESGPVLIEVPIERGGETTPWTFIHPAPPEQPA